MAASPKYKVFNPRGEYVASCKYPDDAACLVALWGNGSSVRLGHSKRTTLWNEGSESMPAGESYDGAANVILSREQEGIGE